MKDFVKITEDNFFEIDEKRLLCDMVETQIFGNVCDNKYCLEESLLYCESPIEQLLAIEFTRIGLESVLTFNPFIDVLAVDKQVEIMCKRKKYRVDFCIPVVYKNQENMTFIVECDGYEFHQKTKEQVERDNERTRDLQEAGYEIIRFSGTEIWHKPYQCAAKVLQIILSKCKYIK